MRRIRGILHLVCLVTLGYLLAACEKESSDGVIKSTVDSAELPSVTNQSVELTFETNDSWKASCSASWVTFSPKSGEAGKNTIVVSTTETNRTKLTRTANLIIECGGQTKNVQIKQRDEYAFFDKEEVILEPAATVVSLSFTSNVDVDKLSVYASAGLGNWITPKESSSTRSEYQAKLTDLIVKENTSSDARDGALFLFMEDNSGNLFPLDTVFIYQKGADNGYKSTDYSADGKVEILNQATIGKGIPIVLMGDGYVDKEVADGTYSKVMKQAMDNLFSEEPIKSLKDYFNVYQVTAVSATNILEGNGLTAIGTIPDHQTTGITVDAGAVQKYVKKVEHIDSIHALAVVIMNTKIMKGVTYMMRDNKDVSYCYSIALCPVIDSLKSELFREVLTHEAIGHGFAKLADEYVRSTEGSATEDDIKLLKELHEKWTWFMNVDSESDPTKVLWSKFISDSEYTSEKIGVYEGAYTFYKGAYRPSEESMMRSNDAPFNAPSRQAIYNRVMELGMGYTPDYSEFVAFDKVHKPSIWSYSLQTRSGNTRRCQFSPPRIIVK